MQESIQYQGAQTRVLVNNFIRSVYNWMAAGLALTGFMAFFVANSPTLLNLIYGNPLVLLALIIGEFVLVFSISSRVHKMEASTATGLFLLFAALNGATLSSILLTYAQTSIALAFFICAGTFVACSVYGMTTQKDLTGIGQFMFMGLVGIVIATLVNIFLRSSAMQMIISYIGVFVFVGLTAYDTQKLKQMALTQPEGLDAGVVRKGSIIGALTLYLDFINMFIFILHIVGGNRE